MEKFVETLPAILTVIFGFMIQIIVLYKQGRTNAAKVAEAALTAAATVKESTDQVASDLAANNATTTETLGAIKATGEVTHQIVNSQKTAMEEAIQRLKLTVAELKANAGIPIEASEMPSTPIVPGESNPKSYSVPGKQPAE